ncbi:MAG: hypothetical protein WAZ24_13470, partial [Blautia wexlerae]
IYHQSFQFEVNHAPFVVATHRQQCLVSKKIYLSWTQNIFDTMFEQYRLNYHLSSALKQFSP